MCYICLAGCLWPCGEVEIPGLMVCICWNLGWKLALLWAVDVGEFEGNNWF